MAAAFAIWLTGLPASGKSTITRALVVELAQRGIHPAVLESDVVRRVLTPVPTYTESERETFYRGLVYIGALLVEHGVPVIFDATANRRAYRDEARRTIPRFAEIHVDAPLEVCLARDPKDLYAHARTGSSSTLPGVQTPYEPPRYPDLVVPGAGGSPEASARAIVLLLDEKAWLGGPSKRDS